MRATSYKSNPNCNIGIDVVGSKETRRIARCRTVDIKLLRPTTMIRLGETQLLDCALDAQTDSLRYEIIAINELFTTKNGGACPKTCK